jgi:hypothetical protein
MLDEYTRAQKKKAAQDEGTGFDGELTNFQRPLLSSLSKLVSALLYFYFPRPADEAVIRT